MNKIIKEEGPDPTLDTTKFVNLDTEPFDIYSDGKLTRHFEAGESQEIPVFVAQVGAKHLADKLLQGKGVKDSMRDTPERKSLFAQIMPDWAEEIDVKPQTDEEFRAGINEQLKDQAVAQKKLQAEFQEVKDSKDDEIAKLKRN